MKNISIIMVFMICMVASSAPAQTVAEVYYPKVGEQIINHNFTDLENYPSKNLAMNDLKGKWVLLDFWSKGCPGCIASFRKMDHLQQQFRDSVQLVMVGIHSGGGNKAGSSDEEIKKVFKFYKNKYNLKFTVAFDSTAQNTFDIAYIPHIIVIDPIGKIVLKANSLDSTQLSMVMSGKNIKYIRGYSAHEPAPYSVYNDSLPFLSSGEKINGGIDTAFLFRSIITKWNSSLPPGYFSGIVIKENTLSKVEILGADLSSLLRIAYTGHDSWLYPNPLYENFLQRIVLEGADSTIFKKANNINGDNKFCYSLIFKGANFDEKKLRAKMQTDLQDFFGFTAKIEKRNVPVWKIVVLDQKKAQLIRAKNTKPTLDELPALQGFECKNWELQDFVRTATTAAMVNSYADEKKDFSEIPPLFDATGMNYKVDLKLNADIYDIKDIKKALNLNGLDLVLDNKEMNCIAVKPI